MTLPTLPTLHLQDVACRRGDRWLFAGVSLSLPAGRRLWLRGGNGRGKTSLLRIAVGLARPERGRAMWGDVESSRSPAFLDARLYLAHANALKDDLTVAEALAFLDRLKGGRADPRAVEDALEVFGMASRRQMPVRTLSQGQRRRVALARLALEDREDRPGLWVLDEPFDALDTTACARLDALIGRHLDRGGSVLLTSHRPLAPYGAQSAELDLDALRTPRTEA